MISFLYFSFGGHMKTLVPHYYKQFKCKAELCRHTCCKGWEIDIDDAALSKYRHLNTRFGREFSADITGFHMGGAYAVGFAFQLIFGFAASATTFKITPPVLITVCICAVITHEAVIRKANRGK